MGRIDEAIVQYKTAITLNANLVQVLNNLGSLLLAKGKIIKAIGYFAKAVEVSPDFTLARHNLGLALLRQGYLDQAVFHLYNVVSTNPGTSAAQQDLLIALSLQKQIQEAVLAVQEILEYNPRESEFLEWVKTLDNRKNNLNIAFNRYESVLSRHSQNKYLNFENIKIVQALGRLYEGSASLLKKIATHFPDSPSAFYHIACIAARQNRSEESHSWLAKAIELGFNHQNLLNSDRDIKDINVGSSQSNLRVP